MVGHSSVVNILVPYTIDEIGQYIINAFPDGIIMPHQKTEQPTAISIVENELIALEAEVKMLFGSGTGEAKLLTVLSKSRTSEFEFEHPLLEEYARVFTVHECISTINKQYFHDLFGAFYSASSVRAHDQDASHIHALLSHCAAVQSSPRVFDYSGTGSEKSNILERRFAKFAFLSDRLSPLETRYDRSKAIKKLYQASSQTP